MTQPPHATTTGSGDAAPVEPAPAPRRAPAAVTWRPRPLPVYLGSAALFAGLWVVFAGRMLAGEDPALGAGAHAAVAAAAPPAVLVRKVIVTRHVRVDGLTRAQLRRRGVERVLVVRRPAPAAGVPLAGAAATAAAAVVPAAGSSQPVASAAAPAASAPAPRRSAGASAGASAATPPAAASTVTTVAAATTPAAGPAGSYVDPALAGAAAAPAAVAAPAPVVTTTS